MQRAMKKWFPVLALPTVVAFLIAFIIPFIVGIWLSFNKFKVITNTTFVGFSNYVKAFDSPDFMNALWFTVKFTVVSVITVNIFAFLLALLLTKALKGTNLFRTVFFMPNLIGGIVLGWIWQLIINGILKATLGVTMAYDPAYGFWGLVVLMNWQLIGYMMIIYIAGIQNVSPDQLEAASIDGANGVQKLFHITIPSVMSSITICLFLTLTNSFKLFDQNLALTAGAPDGQTKMLALDIYETFYNRVGFQGVGQAKAVVFFLIVAVIALSQLYLTRRKEVEN